MKKVLHDTIKDITGISPKNEEHCKLILIERITELDGKEFVECISDDIVPLLEILEILDPSISEKIKDCYKIYTEVDESFKRKGYYLRPKQIKADARALSKIADSVCSYSDLRYNIIIDGFSIIDRKGGVVCQTKRWMALKGETFEFSAEIRLNKLEGVDLEELQQKVFDIIERKVDTEYYLDRFPCLRYLTTSEFITLMLNDSFVKYATEHKRVDRKK